MAAKHSKTKVSWQTGDSTREQPKICSVSGKRIYASEGEAKATATHRMSDKEGGPTQLRIYKCLHCNGWHLTSKQT
jgi:hypothetical protein